MQGHKVPQGKMVLQDPADRQGPKGREEIKAPRDLLGEMAFLDREGCLGRPVPWASLERTGTRVKLDHQAKRVSKAAKDSRGRMVHQVPKGCEGRQEHLVPRENVALRD